MQLTTLDQTEECPPLKFSTETSAKAKSMLVITAENQQYLPLGTVHILLRP